jgi:hypothetical protein
MRVTGERRDIRSSTTDGPFGSTCHEIWVSGTPPFTPAQLAGSNIFYYNLTVIRYQINEREWIPVRNAGKSDFGELNKPIQSAHVGGANVLLGDASVDFLDESTTLDVVRALACRFDGEPTTD